MKRTSILFAIVLSTGSLAGQTTEGSASAAGSAPTTGGTAGSAVNPNPSGLNAAERDKPYRAGQTTTVIPVPGGSWRAIPVEGGAQPTAANPRPTTRTEPGIRPTGGIPNVPLGSRTATSNNTVVGTLGAWLNRLQLDVQQVLPLLEAYTQPAAVAPAPGAGNAPGVPAGGGTSAIVPSPGQPAANFGAQYGSSSASQAGVNAGVNAGVPAAGGGNLALNQTPGPVGSGYRNTGPGSTHGTAPVGNLALNQTPGPVGSANRGTAATTTTGDAALSRTGVNNPYGLPESGTAPSAEVSSPSQVAPELAILKSDLERILPVLVAINNGGILRAANSTGASVETGTGTSVGSGSSAVNTIPSQNPGAGATVPDTQGNVRTGEQNMAPPGNRTTGGSGAQQP